MDLTEKQRFIIANRNEWFTEQEILESLVFEMPRGYSKINEKTIYFNLQIMTGIDYSELPGDIQSIYWFICKKWNEYDRQFKIREFLKQKWGYHTEIEYEQMYLPYAAVLYAVSKGNTVVRIKQDHLCTFFSLNEYSGFQECESFEMKPLEYETFLEKKIIHSSPLHYREDLINPVIGVDKAEFYDSIFDYYEMNRI